MAPRRPHHLTVRSIDGSAPTLAQGQPGLVPDAQRLTRAGLGHPEGFLRCLANLYLDIADDLLARRDGRTAPASDPRYPTVRDGVIGVRFVEAVAASHTADGRWTDATLQL